MLVKKWQDLSNLSNTRYKIKNTLERACFFMVRILKIQPLLRVLRLLYRFLENRELFFRHGDNERLRYHARF